MEWGGRIVVIGLGYVGLPLAVALARKFKTIGFDIDEGRVMELRGGQDRTCEVNEDQLRASSLRLASEASDCAGADVYIVTVPTPVDEANRPDLGAVLAATRTIAALIDPVRRPTVVYESTVCPGVTEDLCGLEIERTAGLTRGPDFRLGYSPERINTGDREHRDLSRHPAQSVILPSALTGHGVAVVWFLLTRFPYDRIGLAAGFLLHVAWLYLLYIRAERKVRRRIAVVPFGAADKLLQIESVDWHLLVRPRLHDARSCSAVVADFSAELPDEWEAFLADAALAGRIVYQVKQLAESLTGRVELERLSENSFGSLVPAIGYFYLKGLADFLFALLLLPVVLPFMGVVALAIRLDSKSSVPPETRRSFGQADHRP